MFKPPQWRDRQAHAHQVGDLAGPRTRRINRVRNGETSASFKAEALYMARRHVRFHHTVLDVRDTEGLRLLPETPEETVPIAPAVARRIRTATEVVNIHGREMLAQLGGRQQLY